MLTTAAQVWTYISSLDSMIKFWPGKKWYFQPSVTTDRIDVIALSRSLVINSVDYQYLWPAGKYMYSKLVHNKL